MTDYYTSITDDSTLSRRSGTGANVAPEFYVLSSLLISRCSFFQGLIQQIVYTSHGAELHAAKQALRDFPNPKARIDFLCAFPYAEEDSVTSKVFEYAKCLFQKLYELRNALAHEDWSSSDDYPGAVILSSLDEQARLLMTSGRVWHKEDATPQEVYDATIRFIRSVKVVTLDHLRTAVRDMDLCSWMLMQVSTVLSEEDPARKEQGRQAFFVYQGTAHLFDDAGPHPPTVELGTTRHKAIRGH